MAITKFPSPNERRSGHIDQVNGNFLNNTDLDEKQARKLLTSARDMVLKGESYVESLRENALENKRIYKNEIWDANDLEFFKSLDATPYQFAYARVYLNNLVSQQRNRRMSFRFTPNDSQAFVTHRRGRETFIERYHKRFATLQEAEDYYDKHSDDKYGEAIDGLVHNARQESGARFIESEAFEEGLVESGAFLKCVYSDKYNPDGNFTIEQRNVSRMFWDRTDHTYNLENIDFIGEIHDMDVQSMIGEWPHLKQQIEELYADRTNVLRNAGHGRIAENWGDFIRFTDSNTRVKLKVAELYYKDVEPRLKTFDSLKNQERMLRYDITDHEQVKEMLGKKVVVEMLQHLERHDTMPDWVDDPELLQQPDAVIEAEVRKMVEQRFDIIDTWKPVWNKIVITYNGILEHKRHALPHGGHPYSPYWPQFLDGYPTGILDDIRDPVIALNKALVFRDLMMAHGSKGLVVVNKDMFADAGYSEQDIADAYTSVGSLLFLKVKRGQRIEEAMSQITTVGDGIEALNAMINDYRHTLQSISGVTLAQMGQVQGETPTSRYQIQLDVGQMNNGIMYDNFFRTLNNFYGSRVAPMARDMIRTHPHLAIRMLGDEYRPWLEIDHEQDFGVFDDYTSTGKVACTVEPVHDTPTLNEARFAKLLEMSLQRPQEVPLEFVLKYSGMPKSADMIKDLKEYQYKALANQMTNQIQIQKLAEILQTSDLNPEAAKAILKRVQQEASKASERQQTPAGSGGEMIGRGGAEMHRQQDITQALLTQ